MEILDTIGDTPLVKISDNLYAKLELYNPTGSIKDRMASWVLSKAEEKGEDIFVFDGSHLNDIGNKIYGSEIGKEIIKIIK